MAFALLDTLWGVICCVYDIICIWHQKLWNWLRRKSRADLLLETLGEAKIYEEWRAAAFQLDECLNYDLWRQNSASKYYDYRLIHRRLTAFYEAEDSDILSVINLIRTGLVRNLGNITSSRLYNRAYGGTKLLIEDYIDQVVRAISSIVSFPTDTSTDNGFTPQVKLDVLHDTRLAFGRTVLVLQGGAIFGLCHLGVVKALLLRGLLPRIIAGTATGAIIAALVCVHREEELFDICNGKNIDITAFTNRPTQEGPWKYRWLNTLQRRVTRWWKEGHFLDVDVLEQLLRDNIGDMTFEEAYERTRRVLNITVSTSGGGGVPNVLNYISAPNVLIWSAALASNATSSSALYRPVTVLCKDVDDEIVPWFPATQTTFQHWTRTNYRHRESPLHRIGELFNVNHYIVSQARPYLVPFLRSDLHHPHPKQARMWRLTTFISRLTVLEIQHRLHQLNTIGWLSPSIRRFLLDESVPGSSLTLVPELTPTDFGKLLEHPSKETVDYWVLKGEKSVWPALAAIKSRVAIEIELDKAYQTVRRRKPSSLISAAGNSHSSLRKSGSQGEVNRQRGREDGDREERLSRRKRAKSFGDGMGQVRMT